MILAEVASFTPNVDDGQAIRVIPRHVSVPFAGVDCDVICAINFATTVRAHKRGVIGIRPNVDDGQATREIPRHVSVPFAGVDCDAICAINVVTAHVCVTTVRAHKRRVQRRR